MTVIDAGWVIVGPLAAAAGRPLRNAGLPDGADAAIAVPAPPAMNNPVTPSDIAAKTTRRTAPAAVAAGTGTPVCLVAALYDSIPRLPPGPDAPIAPRLALSMGRPGLSEGRAYLVAKDDRW